MVHHPDMNELDPYERLLGDAMLFAREDFVEAAWAIVGPVLGDVTPAYSYEQGQWGPREADRLAESVGGWVNPAAPA